MAKSLFGVVLAIVLLPLSLVFAQPSEWRLYPNPGRGEVPDYRAAFDKHFKVADGVLIGRCNLGPEFFSAIKTGGVFASVGMLWATNDELSRASDHFKLTFDYKWFQEEPLKKYGDFPDLHVGFRLHDGKGYYLRWGMLGQIILRRMDGANDIAVAQGTHPGIKGKWTRVKILAAGPILKAKIWSAAKPEPATWSAEAFDNWSPTGDYQRGAIALGFVGRKLFDTCVYEFKEVTLRTWNAEQAAAVKSFDPADAPAYIGFAKNSDTTEVKVGGLDVEFNAASSKEFARADNLVVNEAVADGVELSSNDGKPAFLWIPVEATSNLWGVRAKAGGDARPLFAIKATDKKGHESFGVMDPQWRDGFAALLAGSADHTSGVYRYTFKPDVWQDYVLLKAHWQKWQILTPDEPANRVAFVSPLISSGPGTRVRMGIGVVGKGTVTVKGTLKK